MRESKGGVSPCMLMPFLLTGTKHLTKLKDGFIWAWWPELEAAGRIAAAVRTGSRRILVLRLSPLHTVRTPGHGMKMTGMTGETAQ